MGSWDTCPTVGTLHESPEMPEVRWTPEATGVTAISLAAVGPGGLPLLGYLATNSFYAGEGLSPAAWVDEADGVAEMAVAADPAPGSFAGPRLCHGRWRP